MASRLMEIFRLGRCSHEFSWPRRWPDGDYYQVCLICGEEYKYDWKTMSRLERVVNARPIEPLRASRHERARSGKRTSWTPRARRIKLKDKQLKYRVVGTANWHQAPIENISQTGVLFRPADLVPENTEVEVILEMPREISGGEHTQVVARGMVVRSTLAEDGRSRPAVAVGIWDYKVLHEKDDPSLASQGPEPPATEQQPS